MMVMGLVDITFFVLCDSLCFCSHFFVLGQGKTLMLFLGVTYSGSRS